jgi:hypothetical protein
MVPASVEVPMRRSLRSWLAPSAISYSQTTGNTPGSPTPPHIAKKSASWHDQDRIRIASASPPTTIDGYSIEVDGTGVQCIVVVLRRADETADARSSRRPV